MSWTWSRAVGLEGTPSTVKSTTSPAATWVAEALSDTLEARAVGENIVATSSEEIVLTRRNPNDRRTHCLNPTPDERPTRTEEGLVPEGNHRSSHLGNLGSA